MSHWVTNLENLIEKLEKLILETCDVRTLYVYATRVMMTVGRLRIDNFNEVIQDRE